MRILVCDGTPNWFSQLRQAGRLDETARWINEVAAPDRVSNPTYCERGLRGEIDLGDVVRESPEWLSPLRSFVVDTWADTRAVELDLEVLKRLVDCYGRFPEYPILKPWQLALRLLSVYGHNASLLVNPRERGVLTRANLDAAAICHDIA